VSALDGAFPLALDARLGALPMDAQEKHAEPAERRVPTGAISMHVSASQDRLSGA